MRKVFLIAAATLGLAACGTYYRPSPEERIHIVDSPADIRACRRLGVVSPIVPTTPGFVHHIDAMLTATVALGGTDLYLRRVDHDWGYVEGIAYLCPFGRPSRIISDVVVRARG